MAIAFVAAADLGNNGGGGAYTVSYTVGAGSDRLLVVALVGAVVPTDNITGVTYAGVSMTLINKRIPSTGRCSYLFYLLNPASGANNIVVTNSSNEFIIPQAADYTGVKGNSQ